MNYVLTFEDGSSAYLEHYGVKGMKWGKWNAETRARYSNAGNGTYYKKATRGDKYGRAVTDQRRAYNARQPKGKQIAKNILLGPGGAHAYNTSRSRGLSRADSLQNARLGVLYAQGVKHKQKKAGTTETKLSEAAKERARYAAGSSIKKDALKTFLIGDGGSIIYNSVAAKTKSRGKAVLATVGVATAQSVTNMPVAYATQYAIRRRREKSNQTGKLPYNING